MSKKAIAMTLSIAALLCLAACGPTTNPEPAPDPAASIAPAAITDQTEELSEKLIPLDYQEGEMGESPYYRIASVDGQLCYEVQIEGEEERTQVPIDSVIYLVSSPEECRLEKVSFQYTPEGGETETVEQYRIYVLSGSGGVFTGGEEPAETPESGDETPVDDIAHPSDEPVQEEALPEASANSEN